MIDLINLWFPLFYNIGTYIVHRKTFREGKKERQTHTFQSLKTKGSPSGERKYCVIRNFYSSAWVYFNITSMRLVCVIDEPVRQQLEMIVSLTTLNLSDNNLSGWFPLKLGTHSNIWLIDVLGNYF